MEVMHRITVDVSGAEFSDGTIYSVRIGDENFVIGILIEIGQGEISSAYRECHGGFSFGGKYCIKRGIAAYDIGGYFICIGDESAYERDIFGRLKFHDADVFIFRSS